MLLVAQYSITFIARYVVDGVTNPKFKHFCYRLELERKTKKYILHKQTIHEVSFSFKSCPFKNAWISVGGPILYECQTFARDTRFGQVKIRSKERLCRRCWEAWSGPSTITGSSLPSKHDYWKEKFAMQIYVYNNVHCRYLIFSVFSARR